MNDYYISTAEAAKLMGISRVAVFKKIKKGQIEAQKVGRNYIVDKRSLGDLYQDLSPDDERRVDKAVEKAALQYGETLKRLGRQ